MNQGAVFGLVLLSLVGVVLLHWIAQRTSSDAGIVLYFCARRRTACSSLTFVGFVGQMSLLFVGPQAGWFGWSNVLNFSV